jgi:hypothetical protein
MLFFLAVVNWCANPTVLKACFEFLLFSTVNAILVFQIRPASLLLLGFLNIGSEAFLIYSEYLKNKKKLKLNK